MPRSKPIPVPTPVSPRGVMPLDAELWHAVALSLELSSQQTRIVELLLQGMRDKQIAQQLRLGVPTVRSYLSRIFLKLQVQDRVELILHVFAVAESLRATPPFR